MNFFSVRSSRSFGLGFLLFAGFLLVWPVACGPHELSVALYQFSSSSSIKLEQISAVIKKPSEVTVSDETKPSDLGAGSLRLPTFRCKKWQKEKPVVGLLPSLIVNGYAKGQLVLSGRFPIDIACKKLSASVFMSPPGQLSPWRSLQDERENQDRTTWARVGHRVLRLPDGRYLVTGGMGKFSFSSKGHPQVSQPIKETFVYSPATGVLSNGPNLADTRAFHAMSVVENKVILVGGLKASGELAKTEVFSLPGFDAVPENAWPESVKTLNPRAFQKLIHIPTPGDKERVAQVGGISCPVAKMDKNCQGSQLLYSSVVEMPERGLIMVIGGMRYDKVFKKWKPHRSVSSFSIERLSTPFEITDATATIALISPRMGHTAVRESRDRIWIMGGVFAREGQLRLVNTQATSAVDVLSLDQNGRMSLSSLSSIGSARYLSRVFAKGVPLGKGMMLLTGGFDGFTKSFPKNESIAKQALILHLESNDPSSRSYNIRLLAQEPRLMHSLVVLPTGQFLLTGGLSLSGQVPTSKVELYNPALGKKIGHSPEFTPIEPRIFEPSTEPIRKEKQPSEPFNSETSDASPDVQKAEFVPEVRTESTIPKEPSLEPVSESNPDAGE